MMHVDAPECQGRGHPQCASVDTIEEHTAAQHIIPCQQAMHIVENHIAHLHIILVQVHTVQQGPFARETALPQ